MNKSPRHPIRNPEALKTSLQIIDACKNAKASKIKLLDVSDVFDLSDFFIIASGRSDRQVQGICNRIRATLEESGREPLAIEGFDDGHWVLIDYGDVIIHVFYEPMREHYDIESLWVKAKALEIPSDDTELQAA